MPTKKQLSDRRASEMGFGHYNNDDGYNIRGSHMAGFGNKTPTELTGKVIGHYEYDEENDDIKIVIDPETPLEDTPEDLK